MNYSTSDFSLNDRKKLVLSHFDQFESKQTDFTLNELYDFFDKKMGKPFDRNIGFQIYEIIKGENEKINLSDFITQYLDTEDTLNFRIDLDKKRIEELISQKEGLFRERAELRKHCEEKGEFLKLYSVLRLNLKEANNLESRNFNSEVNSYVKILAGERIFHTSRVNSENNPEYNQTFEIIMREDVREIVMIICDSEKVGEENIVGSVKISIDEIYERNSDEKTEYLMREDGLRTISKLMFSYKVEPSKLKEIEEMSNKIDYEVKDVEQIMKQNQKALFLLREPFSTRLKMVNNAKLQKNDIFQDQNYRNNDADLETNDDNKENGKITPFEELMKVRFERLAKKLRVKDWQKILVVSTAIFIFFILFISFLRSSFYDIMLVGIILIKGRTNFEKFNLFFMRIILILLIFSIVMDLIWLIFYTDNWDSDDFEASENSLKVFVIVISYMQFFYKVALPFFLMNNSLFIFFN